MVIDSRAPSDGLDLVDPQVRRPEVFDREFMYYGDAINHGRKIIGGMGENCIGCTGLLGGIGSQGRRSAYDESTQHQAYYQSNIHFTLSQIVQKSSPACLPGSTSPSLAKHKAWMDELQFPACNGTAMRLAGFPTQVNGKLKHLILFPFIP